VIPDAAAVLAAFGLPGEPVDVAEVAGGWSNAVWRVGTADGSYAVKALRNAWGEPRWLEWLAEAWRVERAALTAGIPMPEPLVVPGADGCVAWVEGVPVRVHRWVESSVVPREPVGADLARWVGGAVAGVHALALRPMQPDLYDSRTGLTTAEHWPALVGRARALGAGWADELAASLPLAQRASALLEPWDDADAVLVHADVDQKNLIVSLAGPLLIDWDVVVPAVPSHDLAHAALTMGSWRDPAAARAVLEGYADVTGARPRLRPADLGPALASRLGWIRFTADRALDAVEAGTDVGTPGLPALLADLEHRVAVAEQLPAWLHP
jgi:Ser/Thr protein kinase RdoA (MazF antagonist)